MNFTMLCFEISIPRFEDTRLYGLDFIQKSLPTAVYIGSHAHRGIQQMQVVAGD